MTRFAFTRLLLAAALLGTAPAGAHEETFEGHHDGPGHAAHGCADAADAPLPDGAGTTAVLGDLEIGGAFVLETVPAARSGGGYLTIANTGAADDLLVSATTDAAAVTELHQMRMDGEVMLMRPVDGGIPVPAGETVTLAPGGLHLMFIDLAAPFTAGETVTVTLGFEVAGEVEIELPVLARGEAAPSGGHGGHGH